MATPDRSIFRQRALDTYMRGQEKHVVLRLVSPRMLLSLWMLLLLAIGGGVLVWSIREPVLVQGQGLVVQPNMMRGSKSSDIVVLLLFPPDQQANLKVGQSVSISIATANITFNSTIQTLEEGTMSPAEISNQISSQPNLAQTISGPSVVALAPVEPMPQAKTYLGSQCQVKVQIGSRSAISLLPGYHYVAPFFDALSMFAANSWRHIKQLINQ